MPVRQSIIVACQYGESQKLDSHNPVWLGAGQGRQMLRPSSIASLQSSTPVDIYGPCSARRRTWAATLLQSSIRSLPSANLVDMHEPVWLPAGHGRPRCCRAPTWRTSTACRGRSGMRRAPLSKSSCSASLPSRSSARRPLRTQCWRSSVRPQPAQDPACKLLVTSTFARAWCNVKTLHGEQDKATP